jgi:hypothetical protein
MAMPPPDKPSATTANLDAWKKVAGVTNEGVVIVEKPKPTVTGVVRQREDSPVPEIGSDGFTAADAIKSATQITEEYTLEELTDIVDNTMKHIRSLAENGEMEAGIDTQACNNGLRKALIKELKHRGFNVKENKIDGVGIRGLDVSWEPFDWAAFGKSVIGPIVSGLVLVSLITLLAFGAKSCLDGTIKSNPSVQQQLERSK